MLLLPKEKKERKDETTARNTHMLSDLCELLSWRHVPPLAGTSASSLLTQYSWSLWLFLVLTAGGRRRASLLAQGGCTLCSLLSSRSYLLLFPPSPLPLSIFKSQNWAGWSSLRTLGLGPQWYSCSRKPVLLRGYRPKSHQGWRLESELRIHPGSASPHQHWHKGLSCFQA